MYLLVLSSDALNSHRTARHLLTYSTDLQTLFFSTHPQTALNYSAHLQYSPAALTYSTRLQPSYSPHLQHSPTALTYSTHLQHSPTVLACMALAGLTYLLHSPFAPHRTAATHL